jgi:HEAT repeat protein
VKTWALRYFAGQNAVGWNPAISVSPQIPEKWQLITRDLFKDHGEFTLTGIAFTAMYGEPAHALFDHLLLGRTIADLDKSTDLALGRIKPAKPLGGKERDRLWEDLLSPNRPKASTAIRAFLASAPDHVTFIRDKIAVRNPDKDRVARIRQLAADLDDDEFETREKAMDALIKLGAPAIETLRTLAANSESDEVRFRARIVLKKLHAEGNPLSPSGKMARVVRVLERADTGEARDLLTRMAEGEFGFDGAPDARAALQRMPKKP